LRKPEGIKSLRRATEKMEEVLHYEEKLFEAFAKGRKPPMKYSGEEMEIV
jgi:hypothetical protein